MSRTVVIALGTLLGLQSIRALLPLLVYVLRDRFGWPTLGIGGLALALFATAFLFPLAAAPGRRARTLATAALLLATARLGLQLWSGDPVGSLAFAAAGLLGFLGMLAAVSGPVGGTSPTVAVLLGVLVDTALHGAGGTRDLHWGGTLSTAVSVSLALALAAGALRAAPATSPTHAPDDRAPALPGLFAWGPFLLLNLELLANVARFSARTGLPTATSGTLVGLGLAAALVFAARDGRSAPPSRGVAAVATVALVVGLLGAEVPGPTAFPMLFLGQFGAALLLLRASAPDSGLRAHRPGRRCLAFGAGFLALFLLLFGHYAGYDLPIPGTRLTWLLGGALALAAAALARSGLAPSGDVAIVVPRPRRLAWLAPSVALLPLLHGFPTAPAATPALPGTGATLRAVSFNVHSGFDERGAFAFGGMMEHLRDARPDVVALQEVSRGWVMNGSSDLFELAREALGLHALSGPSVFRDWGNAVFARAELKDLGTGTLPPAGLPMPRAVTHATLPWGGGEEIRVLATHFHHLEGGPGIRTEEARFLADRFAPAGPALLLGDFNADQGAQCLEVLRQDGWQDVAGPAGAGSPTFPSATPIRRIDTIFHGPGLLLRSTEVAEAWGSDHRAVIADFEVRPVPPGEDR